MNKKVDNAIHPSSKDPSDRAFLRLNRKLLYTYTLTVFCLSISHQKWIITDGMSTYIGELFDKTTKKKIPLMNSNLNL